MEAKVLSSPGGDGDGLLSQGEASKYQWATAAQAGESGLDAPCLGGSMRECGQAMRGGDLGIELVEAVAGGVLVEYRFVGNDAGL